MQEFFSRVFGLLFFHFAANFQILFSWQLRKKKKSHKLGSVYRAMRQSSPHTFTGG